MNSPLDTLKQLKEMLDAGTITPQEFEALKQQLVFQPGPAAPSAPPTEALASPAAATQPAGPASVSPPSEVMPTADLPTLVPTGPPPVATPVLPPPAAPTETPEWMAAPAPMLLSNHDASPELAERRNPLTLVFAIGGALVLLALVLYLALDNKPASERLTSATQTAADSTAVVPEVGPQANQITLPPATAPETVRVAPATPPVVPAAATKFSSDSVPAPTPAASYDYLAGGNQNDDGNRYRNVRQQALKLLAGALTVGLGGCVTLLKPVRPFSVASAGPAPDYAQAANWAALPGQPSAALAHPPGLPAPQPADTVADVFFVHPTTYFWRLGRWNAPLRLRRLRRYTDRTTIRDQASIFAAVGRLYAPRYRQATLYTFFDQQHPSSQPAQNLAYADVKAAFQYYLAHYNHGRPFIVAGHSQGTLHATRLLHELVDDNPQLRRQLVAAYLVGYQAHPNEYQHLPALRDSLATGGIVGWNTTLHGTDYAPYHGLLATNPLTWTLDTAAAPAILNRGGVPLNFRRVDLHVTGAQVHRGLIWAADPHLSGYRRLRIPGLKQLSYSYHLMDYNFFYLNVRENARTRVRAWQR